jgi:hypothetical protein
MSIIRSAENDKRLADNPKRFFTFRGVQATGSSGGLTNNLWNFEVMVRNGAQDVNGFELDFLDRWPEYGEIGVAVNGDIKHDRDDWTLVAHSDTNECTLTFNNSIADDARVRFEF